MLKDRISNNELTFDHHAAPKSRAPIAQLHHAISQKNGNSSLCGNSDYDFGKKS
jgi:hypothetical protein